MKAWRTDNCPCRLSRSYIDQDGFVWKYYEKAFFSLSRDIFPNVIYLDLLDFFYDYRSFLGSN